MPDPSRGPHRPCGLVAQEVERAGLCDVIPPVAVGRRAGGVVRQGVDGAAMNQPVGVVALRADVQLEDRPVFFHAFQLDIIMEHEGILPHSCLRALPDMF